MRVLHLFSNSKWTGPAEPALRLCIALRDAGVDIAFACQPHAKSGFNKVVAEAEANGITPIKDLYLNKHRNPVHNWIDTDRLKKIVATREIAIVHCHLNNDHRIAARCLGPAGIPIVRSNYDGEGFQDVDDADWLVKHAARIIEPSQRAALYDQKTYDIAPDKTPVVAPSIDTARFDPQRVTPESRDAIGVPEDAFLIGIVARMQPHRHFEDLWKALGQMRGAGVNAHVVVAGRGSKQDRVAREPVHDLGLDDYVHLPGFAEHDAYVARIAAFDANVYLVPGTDGTCRAVREALAMGVPCVVTQRGMLPEIVTDAETGYVTDGSPAALTEALTKLAQDDSARTRMSQAARAYAEREFSVKRQAEAVKSIYAGLA